MRRAVILYNPIAGSSSGSTVAEMATEKLRARGWEVRAVATRGRGDMARVAGDVANEVELLVVAGGDGSLREAVEGLGEARERVTIGFLPAGNANVCAHELGIPRDSEAAIEVVCGGEPTAVDVGVIGSSSGEQIFLAVVGIGFDAITVRYLDRLRHSRLGRVWYRVWADSAYFVCGLLAVLHIRRHRLDIAVDGDTLAQSYRGANLCNFKAYGKGMSLTPDAQYDSGRIHYQARKASNVFALAWHLVNAYRGKPLPRFLADYGVGQRIVVESERGLAVQVDGDYREHAKRIEVGVLPGAIRVLTPRRAEKRTEDPSAISAPA